MQENNKLNRKDLLRYCLMGFLIFVLLACFVTSAIVLPIICSNRRKVASAADTVVVDSLTEQSNSNYTFANITTYDKLYGVFVKSDFSLSSDWIENNKQYAFQFNSFDDDSLNVIGSSVMLSSTTTSGTVSNTIYIEFNYYTPLYLKGLFNIDFSSGFYILRFCVVDDTGTFGGKYITLAYFLDSSDKAVYDSSPFGSFTITDTIGYSVLDSSFAGTPSDISSLPFIKSATVVTGELTPFLDFCYLSVSDMISHAGTSADDIKNAYNDGYSKGISEYLYNSGLVYPLNVDSYVSTGGFSVKNGTETYNVLSAKSVENHTNNNSSTVDVYSFMPYGVNGNLIYTQGASPTVSADFNGTAGYYGVKSSFGGNGVSSVIMAGIPFSLDMVFARSSSNKISGIFTNVDYTILFLDKSMNPIYYNSAYSGDYYINNTILGMGSESNGMLLSDVLTSGDVHFYNFPVDVYGIMLISYHNANEFAHAYSLTARFLGDTKSQDAYDKGFSAGVNSINKNDIFNQGYTKGFNEGSADGANYSFMSLIGAVIDAPISAFTGMFDFTLLGVNLRSFILAMLTLAIVIVLIRIALGGK